jgi:hypothetical protein
LKSTDMGNGDYALILLGSVRYPRIPPSYLEVLSNRSLVLVNQLLLYVLTCSTSCSQIHALPIPPRSCADRVSARRYTALARVACQRATTEPQQICGHKYRRDRPCGSSAALCTSSHLVVSAGKAVRFHHGERRRQIQKKNSKNALDRALLPKSYRFAATGQFAHHSEGIPGSTIITSMTSPIR